MNVQTRYPTTADEFLRWNEGREGKREFVRGKVVELMINTSKRHAFIATRLVLTLSRHLSYPTYTFGSADFAVKTSDGVRYPDVFVDRETPESKGTDLAATEPVFLAEILSPSSYTRDFGEKVTDYAALPSLLHYLVLSQDEPRVWLWSREREGAEWTGPALIAGWQESFALGGLGFTVDLADIYDGIIERSEN